MDSRIRRTRGLPAPFPSPSGSSTTCGTRQVQHRLVYGPGGTGMCIATEIVRKYGWGCDCLTEDMEFSMKVLLEGVRTCWAHDAIIYDEKVVGFMQSCRQRKRWARGQCDCGERFIPKLFARGIKTGNIRMLDGIVTLSQPFFMMASTIYAVGFD